MKSETALFLDQSYLRLANASTMLKANLNNDAARTAYMAAFHAAQALIFEKAEKITKTHNGVQVEFHRLTKDDANLPNDLRSFLTLGFEYKSTADYAVGAAAQTGLEEAEGALGTASRFVSYVESSIGSSRSTI